MTTALEAAWPAEGCGLLAGRRDGDRLRITRVAPSRNVLAQQGNDLFEVDPAARFSLERDLRETQTNECLIGHFHSHPNGQATPSVRDRAQAYEPELIWLIFALNNGRVEDAGAFMIDGKEESQVRRLAVHIESGG